VALVRALARNPRVLLLDEPSTGLDTAVRDELRRDLRALQREVGVTTVLVTHDPIEAAMLADEVVVLARGEMLQAGPQPDVFARPATPTVARLLGVDNLATGIVAGPGRISFGTAELAVVGLDAPAGSTVWWGIRADAIVLAGDGQPAVIRDVVDFGSARELTVDLGGSSVIARTTGHFTPGDRCGVVLPPADVLWWPAEG
jgi:molybdate transport system permease protein